MGGEQEKEEGGRGRRGGRGEREKKVLTTIFIVKRYDEVIHSFSHLFLPIRSVYRGGNIFVPISDKKHEAWSGEVKCHRRSRGGTRH